MPINQQAKPIAKSGDKDTDALMRQYGGGGKAKKAPGPKNKAGASADGAQPLSQQPKKAHYVNLFSEEGTERATVRLPGRHACDCEARRHGLVNNCLSCGRIVCEQEGSGPCLFCGALVCTEKEEEVLKRGSKKSEALRLQLLGGGGNASAVSPPSLSTIGSQLAKASSEKDKLLGYDKDSERRTRVIDDQSDYFSAESSPYISQKERDELRKTREELQSRKHRSRLSNPQKVTIDFMGRTVIDVPSEFVRRESEPGCCQESPDDDRFGEAADFTTTPVAQTAVAHSQLNQRDRIDFDALYLELGVVTATPPTMAPFAHGLSGRLQGGELCEIAAETGHCISVHQPFASLLVAGIKKCEGRSWYSTHRGRLWIAAAAGAVDRQRIAEVEDFYKRIYQDALPVPFPSEYPLGCLLGCVNLVDCMLQEQYLEMYPTGECDDAYIFVCEEPQQLSVKFPLRGQRKIFTLDENVRTAAVALLKG